MLPPAIAEHTSVRSIPLPSGSVVSWQEWRSPEPDLITRATRLLSRLSHREARLSALQWVSTKSFNHKGKSKEDPGSWQKTVLEQTFWILKATNPDDPSFVEPSQPSSSDIECRGDMTSAEAHPSSIETKEGFDPASKGSGSERSTALWVFRIREVPLAGLDSLFHDVASNANAASVLKDDNDLWGDSPAGATSPPNASALDTEMGRLRNQVQAERAQLGELFNKVPATSSRGSIRINDLYNCDSDDLNFLPSLTPKTTHRLWLNLFTEVLRDRTADIFVQRMKASGEYFLALSSAVNTCEGTAIPASGGASASLASDDSVQHQNQVQASGEDGEIVEDGLTLDRISEQGSSGDPSANQHFEDEWSPTRKAVRFRGGFLLLPKNGESRTAPVCLEPERLCYGFFEVMPYKTEDVTRPDHVTGVALTLKLEIQQTGLATLDGTAYTASSQLTVAPQGVNVRLLQDPFFPLPPGDERTAGIIEAAEILASQTGFTLEHLTSDDWVPLSSETEPQKKFYWPKSLCFRHIQYVPFTEKTSAPLSTATPLRHFSVPEILDNVTRASGTQGWEELSPEVSTEQQAQVAKVVKNEPPAATQVDAHMSQAKTSDDTQPRSLAEFATSKKMENSPADSNQDEDLFGSEPGDDDEEKKVALTTGDGHPNSRRPSKNELDEGMYGVVTEDDFAFFDDEEEEEAANGSMQSVDTERTPAAPDVTDDKNQPSPTSKGVTVDERDGAEVKTVLSDPMSEVHHDTVNTAPSTDPSTFPSFTPGSLTESSPTTAGPMDRTPRTPTSPCYDASMLMQRVPHGTFEHGQDGWTTGQAEYANNQGQEDLVEDADTTARLKNGFARLPAQQAHHHEHFPQHKARRLGDKYNSGRFAIPLSLASGIAGSGLKRTKGAHAQTDGSRPQVITADVKVSSLLPVQKLKAESRGDEEMSESGTLASTASNYSEDEAGDDDSVTTSDSEALDDEMQVQGGEQRLDMYRNSTEFAKSHFHSLPSAQWLFSRKATDMTPWWDRASRQDISRGPPRSLIKSPNKWIEWLLASPCTLKKITSLDSRDNPLKASLSPSDCNTVLLCLRDEQDNSFSDTDVDILQDPDVLVGCQGSLVRMAPTALRFWSKLGLSAAAGSRQVAAMFLHSPCGNANRLAEAYGWLTNVKQTFARLGFGLHELAADGILEIGETLGGDITDAVAHIYDAPQRREDTLRSLASRCRGFLGPDHHVVIYAVGELSGSLSDCHQLFTLQQDLQELCREWVGPWSQNIQVRPLTWDAIITRSRDFGLQSISSHALMLYNSLKVVVNPRITQAPRFAPGPHSTVRWLPSFTVAAGCDRSRSQEAIHFAMPTDFQQRTPPRAVFSDPTYLHVAYDFLFDGGEKTVCVSAMDETGQHSHIDIGATGLELKAALRWAFQSVLRAFAHICVNPWRMAICRLDAMDLDEMQAWASLAAENVFLDAPCFEVSILCFDNRTSFLVGHREGPPPDLGGWDAVLVDSARASLALFLPSRVTVPLPRHSETTPLVALETSITVTFPRGSRDAVIPCAGVLRHSLSAALLTGYESSWLHLLGNYRGSLHSTTGHDRDETQTEAQNPSMQHAHRPSQGLRQVTKSLFGLRLIARERSLIDSGSSMPWTVAILEYVRRFRPDTLYDTPKTTGDGLRATERSSSGCLPGSTEDEDVVMATT